MAAMLGPLLAAAAPAAAAGPAEAGLRQPVRLTAGSANQIMGRLAPDGTALVFVGDRDATAELFIQRPVASGPRRLIDSDADTAWPRFSPDGRWLVYISHRADAAGDVCLWNVAEQRRRCLTGLDGAERQALWLDGERLAVLRRDGLHGNLRLQQLGLDGRPGPVLLERNLIGPALSPGGRWLAYVPLERTAQRVGVAFASRSGSALAFQRLDRQSQPVLFRPDLPGAVGYPVFSRDGRFLYFSQYLNDTNGDGTIDGNDNSVLFRVDFAAAAARPISGRPEQLTSARWNCRYPAPTADRLVMTCSHHGSLDIYSLPLDGAVPPGWDGERLRAEVRVARDHWTQLLLLARLNGLIEDAAERVRVAQRMAVLHLELREYASARFYCRRVAALAAGERQPAAWATLVRELAAHRRQDLALARGQLSEQYLGSEAERLQRLRGLDLAGLADAAALRRAVMSEILDDVGRKSEAGRQLAGLELGGLSHPLVVRLVGQRMRQFHTRLADREALVALQRELAGHPALDPLRQLHHAERLVAEIGRGLAPAERRARLEAEREALAPGTAAALMVATRLWLLRLGELDEEEVRAGLFELYKANQQFDRRRALVLAVVRTASRLGNAYLQYQFTTSWASWLERDHPERKYAEALYRRVVLERAYEELADGEVAEARGYFYGTTLQTGSLEAHIGFIEAALREGKQDLDRVYQRRFRRSPDHPERLFVQAYRIARQLPPPTQPERFAREVDRALALLARVERARPRALAVHQLKGALWHLRFRRGGDRGAAIDAHRDYLLALDLARDNPRARAALLHQLGLLQSALGNHRIALGHLQRRDRLPHVRPLGELSTSLARARSAFHSGQPEQAVAQARRALALIERHGELGRFRPLALDRLALYLQLAGEAETALKRYAELQPLLAGAAPLNRFKAHLAAAGAALAAADAQRAGRELDAAAGLLDAAAAGAQPDDSGWHDPWAAHRPGRRASARLFAGPQAQAARLAGDAEAARAALQQRRALLAERLEAAELDDDVLELARVQLQLARLAKDGQRPVEARRHLERGLALARSFNARTGSGVNPVGLRLLGDYAGLYLDAGAAAGLTAAALRRPLQRAYDFICQHPSPSWARQRALFGLVLSLLDLEGGMGQDGERT